MRKRYKEEEEEEEEKKILEDWNINHPFLLLRYCLS